MRSGRHFLVGVCQPFAHVLSPDFQQAAGQLPSTAPAVSDAAGRRCTEASADPAFQKDAKHSDKGGTGMIGGRSISEGSLGGAGAELAEPSKRGIPISTSPRQNCEGVEVELLSCEVTNRSHVLARVCPIGTSAASKETRGGRGQQGHVGFGEDALQLVRELAGQHAGGVRGLAGQRGEDAFPLLIADDGHGHPDLVRVRPAALHSSADEAGANV